VPGPEPSGRSKSPEPEVFRARVLLAPASVIWKASAGSENGWLFDIAEALAGAGYVFDVIAEEADGSGPQDRTVALGKRKIAPLGGLALPFRVASAVVRRRMLANADLVHHGMPFALARTFSLLPLLAARRGVPFVLGPVQAPQSWTGADETWANLDGMAHARLRARLETAIEVRVGPYAERVFGSFSDATLRAAAAVVATGPTAASLLVERGVPVSRVRVIPPPVRAAFFAQGGPPEPVERPAVLTGGVLVERKGVDEVIEAFAGLQRSGVRARLLVYGDGPRRELLESQATRLGIEPSTTFLGWVAREALPGLLRRVDVFVSMSRSESMGSAVAEAMASGVAVLSAANVGAREQIEPGETGLLVDVGDIGACERGLRALLDDANLRRRFAAAGARWTRSHVHPEVVSNAWDNLYRDVLSEPRKSSVFSTLYDARKGGAR
jgi:glycosyltransferase involved in cell wall biosynthesis